MFLTEMSVASTSGSKVSSASTAPPLGGCPDAGQVPEAELVLFGHSRVPLDAAGEAL
jgi:hypothetical protein